MDGPILSPRSFLLALHLLCVAIAVGAAASGMVVRSLAVRESGEAQRVVARLLRDIGTQVEMAGLLGTIATGALLWAGEGVPDPAIWFVVKLVLVATGTAVSVWDGRRCRRAAECEDGANAVSQLLRPGLHQAVFGCYAVAIVLAVGQAL